MEQMVKIIAELGFPIAAALAAGYFVFLTLKFILANVKNNVKTLSKLIVALDNRVKNMNSDVVRIDILLSNRLGLPPDLERVARADGKNDSRKD